MFCVVSGYVNRGCPSIHALKTHLLGTEMSFHRSVSDVLRKCED